MNDRQILSLLDENRALALEKKLKLQRQEEEGYIDWLRKVKPNWSEKQILQSAGKHFNKNFLPEVIEEKIEETEKSTFDTKQEKVSNVGKRKPHKEQ